MFNKNIEHYIFLFIILGITGAVGSKFKQYFIGNGDVEYDMIKKYLLNESPLYGNNKPKLWIHSKYEINSRKWLDFQSRNTYDMNQAYLYLTIQSIIDHCGQDFHICLIDDKSFGNILDDWSVDVSNLSDPMKSSMREIAMMKVLHKYGGMIVPDSFMCMRSLKTIFDESILYDQMFVVESINRSVSMSDAVRSCFAPSVYFMGSPKNNSQLEEIIDHLIKECSKGHITHEKEFVSAKNNFLRNLIHNEKINLIDGHIIGIKSYRGEPILLDDLMEDKFLDISDDCCGIYIPRDELLERTKHQWFVYLSKKEIMNTNIAIVRYLKGSIVDINKILKHDFKSVSAL